MANLLSKSSASASQAVPVRGVSGTCGVSRALPGKVSSKREHATDTQKTVPSPNFGSRAAECTPAYKTPAAPSCEPSVHNSKGRHWALTVTVPRS